MNAISRLFVHFGNLSGLIAMKPKTWVNVTQVVSQKTLCRTGLVSSLDFDVIRSRFNRAENQVIG